VAELRPRVFVGAKGRITLPDSARLTMEIKKGSCLEVLVLSKDKCVITVLVR
jgi:AbrB family looped-hinge helix DNA binding protein